MINTAVARFADIKAVKGTAGCIFQRRQFVRVGYFTSVVEYMVAFIPLIHIKVSGNDHRNAVAQLMGFFDNQFGTFLTGHYAYVVEMCVKEKELETGLLLFEQAPCTDPWQCCIPSLVW